jgi:hypothetical protein
MAKTVYGRKVELSLSNQKRNNPFDDETWSLLPDFLAKLPRPVKLHLWADPRGTWGEQQAVRLVHALSEEFEPIELTVLPRRENYPYYPVLGVFGVREDELVDYGVRIIGLPAGMQITSLIAAIQAVSFQGTTLEPGTRIQLSKLSQEVRLELLSAADDELGTLMAKTVFGFAVSSGFVRSFLIMADVFPEILWRYSARQLPHIVINGQVHADGLLSEEMLLRRIALAVS